MSILRRPMDLLIARKSTDGFYKANVVSCLTNLREVRRVAADVALGELIVDATAVLLIRTSDRFDVIVTTGMFGDVLWDEASGLEAFGPGAAVTVARPRRSRW